MSKGAHKAPIFTFFKQRDSFKILITAAAALFYFLNKTEKQIRKNIIAIIHNILLVQKTNQPLYFHSRSVHLKELGMTKLAALKDSTLTPESQIPLRNKSVFSPRHRHPQWLPLTVLYSFHCEPIIAVMLIFLFNYSAGSQGRTVIKRKICQSEQCQSLAAQYGHVGTERYWAHLRGPARGSKEHPLRNWKTFDNMNANIISWLTSKNNQGIINIHSEVRLCSPMYANHLQQCANVKLECQDSVGKTGRNSQIASMQ